MREQTNVNERRVNTRIGLIDVDGHNYPNLPLMKISAWHKSQGDSVEWYDPWIGLMDEYDKVYMSKVFSFTPDYEHPVYAKEVSKGGADTVSNWLTVRRFTIPRMTLHCPMRLSIVILITHCIQNRLDGDYRSRSKPHTDSSQEDAQEDADSAT